MLDGNLQTANGENDVRVRDFSTRGALVESDEPPAEGEAITLSCLGHHLKGKVAWIDGSWVGITLDTDLPKKTWKELSGNSMRISAPRKYRHDTVEEDPERLEITPRVIRMR